MDLSPQAREHFAKQHMEQAASAVAAVHEVRLKEVEEDRRVYERFYNNLALFSGGSVALSVTYLGYLKTLSIPVAHKGWLIGSWAAFFTCLACSLFWSLFMTHYGHYARDKEYAEAVKERYETEVAEIEHLNVANLQTSAERAAYIGPRKKAAAISKTNVEWNERRERVYFQLWVWSGRLARATFLLGFALLLAFAIKNN
jgi:hypothetical protein